MKQLILNKHRQSDTILDQDRLCWLLANAQFSKLWISNNFRGPEIKILRLKNETIT